VVTKKNPQFRSYVFHGRSEVNGDGSIELNGLAPAAHARAGELTFAENAACLAVAERSQPAAILVAEPFAASNK
jgi:UDP-3-O-[3-hydroxymyristoyl] glucosamine N-acyltransferase